MHVSKTIWKSLKHFFWAAQLWVYVWSLLLTLFYNSCVLQKTDAKITTPIWFYVCMYIQTHYCMYVLYVCIVLWSSCIDLRTSPNSHMHLYWKLNCFILRTVYVCTVLYTWAEFLKFPGRKPSFHGWPCMFIYCIQYTVYIYTYTYTHIYIYCMYTLCTAYCSAWFWVEQKTCKTVHNLGPQILRNTAWGQSCSLSRVGNLPLDPRTGPRMGLSQIFMYIQ